MAVGSVSVEVKPDFRSLAEGLRQVAAHFQTLADDAIRAAEDLDTDPKEDADG
ncbi:hypothetical protein PBI_KEZIACHARLES14_41 [Mycobacterium phage Keziacharles14]|nr:hypothetical protein PBI_KEZIACHARLES14_41 [Mycobacterium phage Keziacharles14]